MFSKLTFWAQKFAVQCQRLTEADSWANSCGMHLESDQFPTPVKYQLDANGELLRDAYGNIARIKDKNDIETSTDQLAPLMNQIMENGESYTDPWHWLPMTRWQSVNDLHSTNSGGIFGFASSLGNATVSLATTWLFSIASFIWAITIFLVKIMIEAPTLATRFLVIVSGNFQNYASAITSSGWAPLLVTVAIFIAVWRFVKSGDAKSSFKRVIATLLPLVLIYVLANWEISYYTLDETIAAPEGAQTVSELERERLNIYDTEGLLGANGAGRADSKQTHISVWLFARTLELSSYIATPVIELSDKLTKDTKSPDQLVTCDAYNTVLEAQFIRAWNSRGEHSEIDRVAKDLQEVGEQQNDLRVGAAALQKWAEKSDQLRLRSALLVSRIWESSYAVGFGQTQFGNAIAAERAFCLYGDWRSRNVTPTEQLAVWRATCLLPKVPTTILPNANHMSLAGCDYFPPITVSETTEERRISVSGGSTDKANPNSSISGDLDITETHASGLCASTDDGIVNVSNSVMWSLFHNGLGEGEGWDFLPATSLASTTNGINGQTIESHVENFETPGIRVRDATNDWVTPTSITAECAKWLWLFAQRYDVEELEFDRAGTEWRDAVVEARAGETSSPYVAESLDGAAEEIAGKIERYPFVDLDYDDYSLPTWLLSGSLIYEEAESNNEITTEVITVSSPPTIQLPTRVYASSLFSPVINSDGDSNRFTTRTLLGAWATCDFTAWIPNSIKDEEKKDLTSGAIPHYAPNAIQTGDLANEEGGFPSYLRVASPSYERDGMFQRDVVTRSTGEGRNKVPAWSGQVVKVDRNVLGLGEGGQADEKVSAKPCFTYLFGTGHDGDEFGFHYGGNNREAAYHVFNGEIIDVETHFGYQISQGGRWGNEKFGYTLLDGDGSAWDTAGKRGYPGGNNKYAIDRLGREPEEYLASSTKLPLRAQPYLPDTKGFGQDTHNVLNQRDSRVPIEANFIPTANTAGTGADIYQAIHGRQPLGNISLGIAALVVAILYAMTLSGLALGSALSIVLLALLIATLPLTLLFMAVPIESMKQLPKQVMKFWLGAAASYSIFLLVITFMLIVIELLLAGTRQINLDSGQIWYSILLGIIPLIAIKAVGALVKKVGADISKPMGALSLTSGMAFAGVKDQDPIQKAKQYSRKGMSYLRPPGMRRGGSMFGASGGGGARVAPKASGGSGALAGAGAGAMTGALAGGVGAAARAFTGGGGGVSTAMAGAGGGVASAAGAGMGGGGGGLKGIVPRLGGMMHPGVHSEPGPIRKTLGGVGKVVGTVARHPAAFAAAAAVAPFGIMPAAMLYGGAKMANRTIGTRMKYRMGMPINNRKPGDFQAAKGALDKGRTRFGEMAMGMGGGAGGGLAPGATPSSWEAVSGGAPAPKGQTVDGLQQAMTENPTACCSPTLDGSYCQRPAGMCVEPSHAMYQQSIQQMRGGAA